MKTALSIALKTCQRVHHNPPSVITLTQIRGLCVHSVHSPTLQQVKNCQHLREKRISQSRKMSTLVNQILGLSVNAARKSADIVREILDSGDLGVKEKTGANDLQTQADRSAQQCIVTSLRKSFPGLAVIGEEEEDEMSSMQDDWLVKDQDSEALAMKIEDPAIKDAQLSDITVWVDPLDGTKEYTDGHLDHVTVLIGIAVGKKAVAGVVNQPFYGYQNKGQPRGRTVFGIVGVGVRGIEKKFPPAEERILTTTRSHSTGLIASVIEACKPTKVIKAGGAGYKVILLIEGTAHAYVFPSPGCKRWDTCAPEAVLHAMGGKLTDIYGNYYDYSKDTPVRNDWGTLATLEADQHDEYNKLIPTESKDQVKDYFKKGKK